MAGLCHKSDLLQRAYLKWTRHGVKHGWLEGVGERDDCSYLKNRELSNDDDGSENVAKKLNLPHFKCYRVYLELLNLSNVGDFSWSWILKDFIQDQKEKGELVVVCSLLKRRIRRFHFIVVQSTSKKCTKKLDASAATVVFMLKPVVFWRRGGSDFHFSDFDIFLH